MGSTLLLPEMSQSFGEIFDSRNLLSSTSTKNSNKSVFAPCRTFSLTQTVGEVL